MFTIIERPSAPELSAGHISNLFFQTTLLLNNAHCLGLYRTIIFSPPTTTTRPAAQHHPMGTRKLSVYLGWLLRSSPSITLQRAISRHDGPLFMKTMILTNAILRVLKYPPLPDDLALPVRPSERAAYPTRKSSRSQADQFQSNATNSFRLTSASEDKTE